MSYFMNETSQTFSSTSLSPSYCPAKTCERLTFLLCMQILPQEVTRTSLSWKGYSSSGRPAQPAGSHNGTDDEIYPKAILNLGLCTARKSCNQSYEISRTHGKHCSSLRPQEGGLQNENVLPSTNTPFKAYTTPLEKPSPWGMCNLCARNNV